MIKEKKTYFFSVFSKITLVIIGLITSALISRGLGVSLKGEYAYLVNLSGIVVIVVTLGVGQVYSYFVRQYGTKYRNIFINLNYIHFVFLIIALLLFSILKNNIVKNIVLLSACGMFRDNFVYLSTVENIKKRNIMNLISKSIFLMNIIIAFLFLKYNLNAFILVLVLDEIIFSLLLIFTYGFFPKKIEINSLEKNKIIVKIYKMGFISMITLLLTTLNYNIDIIILRNLSSSSSVGLYSIGISLANMLWVIPDAFKDVLMNKTSKEDSIGDIIFSLKSNILISLIITLGFILLGKSFITIVYGSEFLDSYITTIILFFGSISMIFHKIISPLLYSKGYQKKLCIIFLSAVFLNIVMNYILIPKFDIIGAAVASVFSYLLAGISILLIFSKMYKLKIKEIIFINRKELLKIKKMIKGA